MKPASKRRIVVHTGESWRPGPLSQRGLVLDDFLAQVDGTRGRFALGPPKFCLKDLLSYPSAKIAIERLIQDTVNLHDGEMYSQPHPLLGECGKSIFGEPISTAAYSGQRISSPWVVPVLQRVLELGLQTVVQLPIREPKPGYAPRQLKVLASALRRLAGRVGAVERDDRARERIQLHLQNGPAGRPCLSKVVSDMLGTAEMLNSAAKVIKIPLGSPNPQVRFAVYLASWVKACAGRPHYPHVQTLIEAAFDAVRKTTPRWVDRLPIEVALQKKHRRAWIRIIFS